LKTVRGIDGVKYIFDAYNVDVPAATLNNSNRLDDYLKTEFGVTMTTAELQKPLTAEDLIALVGHAEEEYGVDEDLEIVE
ncbi:hypothetical protein HY629_02085, partial [Candidatus Uhrbacteria bacterium]|nr:hypothetical protein [Candidatus Uhrbacteria bacterium]